MSNTYLNPILPGFYPDPTVIRVGADFYSAHSSFGYFPGVPIFHSRDLIHWRQVGHALDRASQLPLAGAAMSRGGIYAPTLRFHGGVFYLITTNVSHGGNFIVTASDPAGPWSDPVWLNTPDEGGIDPSLFFDEDGSVYFTGTGNSRVRQFRVDVSTGNPLEPAREAWSGSGGQYPEAPHLFRRGDTYYQTMAEGGTEYMHMQTIARSASPDGPWEPCPNNPILTHRSLSSPLHAVGHGDFVDTPSGDWWFMFHAIRPTGYPPYHVCGRETCIAPVKWTAEGWPVINDGGLISEPIALPNLPSWPWDPEPDRDEFDGSALGLGWNFMRNPVESHYRLSERRGFLGLVPSRDDLSGFGQPTFVGKRQRSSHCVCRASFGVGQLAEGDECGLTIFQNELHHYEIAAVRTGGHLDVIVRRTIGDLCVEVARHGAGSDRFELGILSDPDLYTFEITGPDAQPKTVATAAARYLGTETAGAFTGCYFGLYATCTEPKGEAAAWIDWFELSTS